MLNGFIRAKSKLSSVKVGDAVFSAQFKFHLYLTEITDWPIVFCLLLVGTSAFQALFIR